jgi:hypothetical protein
MSTSIVAKTRLDSPAICTIKGGFKSKAASFFSFCRIFIFRRISLNKVHTVEKVETTNVELQAVWPVPRKFLSTVHFQEASFALLGLKVGWSTTVGMRGMPGGPLISLYEPPPFPPPPRRVIAVGGRGRGRGEHPSPHHNLSPTPHPMQPPTTMLTAMAVTSETIPAMS